MILQPFNIDANMDPYEVFMNFVDKMEKPLPRDDVSLLILLLNCF